MKDYNYLFFLFTLVVVSCTNQADFVADKVTNQNHIISSELNKRSYSEALNAAYNVINNFDEKGVTRSNGDIKRLNLTNGVKYVTSPSSSLTRSASDEPDTLMYVFNFEDEEGFIIISASKNTPPMLALTDNGYYDPSEEQENKGFEQIMNNTIQYVSESFRTPMRIQGPLTPITLDPIYTLLSSVGNFTSVQWGQTGIEGYYCPNGVTGCMITALAMLMSYYEYPQSIHLQHDCFFNPNYSLNWTKMKNHKRDHQYYNFIEPFLSPEDSIQAHEMISHLCRQLGVLSNSSYNIYGTYTDIDGLYSTLNSIGYNTPSYSNYSQIGLMAILNSQHPVYMLGRTMLVGHAWIVDGYRYYSIYEPGVIAIDDEGNYIVEETYYRYYNHINWGWDGKDNGYFIENCFSTTSGIWYDNDENFSDTLNFDTDLQMYDIHPNI